MQQKSIIEKSANSTAYKIVLKLMKLKCSQTSINDVSVDYVLLLSYPNVGLKCTVKFGEGVALTNMFVMND